MTASKSKNLKPTASASKGEYRNLRVENHAFFFEVKLKDGSWYELGGLAEDVDLEDAKKFAQNTADSWRKR